MFKKIFLSLAASAAVATVTTAQQLYADKSVKTVTGYDISDFERTRIGVDYREAAAASSSSSRRPSDMEQAAFDLLNSKRVENGLPPLAWSEQIADVARTHSRNMAEFKFFGHRGLDNKLVSDRADQMKLGRWQAIGENIAYNRGYADPVEKAVDNWLNSQSHRHNLLSSEWKESAVGVAVADDGSYYFTQVFLKK